MNSKLKSYTDWYIPVTDDTDMENAFGCVMIDGVSTKVRATKDSGVKAVSKRLLGVCRDRLDQEDFRIDLEGAFFRGHIINSIDGKVVVLRKLSEHVPEFNSLGLHSQVVARASAKTTLRNGMIIISGAQGQGKSTTAGSLLKHRLEKYGGHAITVEDPIEMPLNGWHGESGMCIQTQVDQHHTFADGVRGAMRSYPVSQLGILMIGEIRDSETAAEGLRAALNGLLVIATVHANNPLDVFSRIESLAKREIATDEARSLMASGFRMLIHQEIKGGKLDAKMLSTAVNSLTSSGMSQKIRDGQYQKLSTEFESQNRGLR